MSTVIDALVVELGIDASKFKKGQQEALQGFKNFQESAVGGAKNIEEQSKKSGEALSGIKTQALEMFAAITGTAGLVQFAAQAVHAGGAVGRLSRNLGVSADVISRFQGLAKVFGGSAEGMAQSFASISDALEGWKIGDIRGAVGEFRALSAAGGTMIDINKGVEQTFLDIAKNLKVLHDQNPATGGYWQRRLGLDPGLYDAMIQKGEGFADLLRKMRGLTDEETEAAGRLERRWNTFTKNATRAGQRMVLDLVDGKSKFNPFQNGSDAKDLKMIAGWVDSLFGTKLSETLSPSTTTSPATAAPSRDAIGNTESRGSGGAFTSQAEKEAFVRQSAVKAGIDPDVAMKVARSEGFSQFLGDNGTSGGAFQLHVTPGGRGHAVGDEFKRLTGLDPLNPANEHEGIMFAMEWAKRHGWGDFHGAAHIGLGAYAGIGRGSTTTNSVVVNGPINVVTNATDATGIAKDIGGALRAQSNVAQSNYGQN